tara:strand:- start:679 stop:819 length:141 start_codon:yes stop_codon:yes gene_type:complete
MQTSTGAASDVYVRKHIRDFHNEYARKHAQKHGFLASINSLLPELN